MSLNEFFNYLSSACDTYGRKVLASMHFCWMDMLIVTRYLPIALLANLSEIPTG